MARCQEFFYTVQVNVPYLLEKGLGVYGMAADGPKSKKNEKRPKRVPGLAMNGCIVHNVVTRQGTQARHLEPKKSKQLKRNKNSSCITLSIVYNKGRQRKSSHRKKDLKRKVK